MTNGELEGCEGVAKGFLCVDDDGFIFDREELAMGRKRLEAGVYPGLVLMNFTYKEYAAYMSWRRHLGASTQGI